VAGTEKSERTTLGPETDAILEYRDGLAQYCRDEKWRRDVIAHFRYNVARMVELARAADVPLWLVNPVSNLRDCAPFKSQHRDGLSEEELRQWEALGAQAAEADRTNVSQSVEFLEQALAIDDQHAGAHYTLAKCYDTLGMLSEARAEYLAAKEHDVCPLRMLEPMHEAVFEIGRATDTPVVDVRELFERASEGIPSGFLLVDHVHPSIAGHWMIADALADELVDQGLVDPCDNWKETKDRRYREHLAALDKMYFYRGQERLEALRLWTLGKGDRPRPAGE